VSARHAPGPTRSPTRSDARQIKRHSLQRPGSVEQRPATPVRHQEDDRPDSASSMQPAGGAVGTASRPSGQRPGDGGSPRFKGVSSHAAGRGSRAQRPAIKVRDKEMLDQSQASYPGWTGRGSRAQRRRRTVIGSRTSGHGRITTGLAVRRAAGPSGKARGGGSRPGPRPAGSGLRAERGPGGRASRARVCPAECCHPPVLIRAAALSAGLVRLVGRPGQPQHSALGHHESASSARCIGRGSAPPPLRQAGADGNGRDALGREPSPCQAPAANGHRGARMGNSSEFSVSRSAWSSRPCALDGLSQAGGGVARHPRSPSREGASYPPVNALLGRGGITRDQLDPADGIERAWQR